MAITATCDDFGGHWTLRNRTLQHWRTAPKRRSRSPSATCFLRPRSSAGAGASLLSFCAWNPSRSRAYDGIPVAPFIIAIIIAAATGTPGTYPGCARRARGIGGHGDAQGHEHARRNGSAASETATAEAGIPTYQRCEMIKPWPKTWKEIGRLRRPGLLQLARDRGQDGIALGLFSPRSEAVPRARIELARVFGIEVPAARPARRRRSRR